jgi:hypothetical protein
MPTDTTTEVYGEVRDSTERAWLFHNGDRQAWLPKSCCAWEPERTGATKGRGVMTVPERMAIEKELV